MSYVNSRNGFLRRLTVLTMVVIGAVIISACAAPAAAPGAQTVSTQAPAASEVPSPTAAPVATEAPTVATVPTATEAPAQAATQSPAADTAGAVSFSKDVMPIFEKTCIKCHGGADGEKGDLDLRTHEAVMKGGKDGVVVVPSDAANSMLVKLINEGKMPKRATRLAQDQLDLIAKWVSEGALNN